MKKLKELFFGKEILNKDENDSTPKGIQMEQEDVVIVQPGAGEYDIVEIEILPEKMICPDCGGITLVGLDFCDKCGGELGSFES